MLLVSGIVLLVLALVLFVLLAFAEGMSTAPSAARMWRSQWPSGLFFLLGIGCLLLHHHLAGKPVTW